jgi:hypothetical protein
MGTTMVTVRIASKAVVHGEFLRACRTDRPEGVYLPSKLFPAAQAGDVYEVRYWWCFQPEQGDMRPLSNNE